MKRIMSLAALAAVVLIASPAQAREEAFTAALRGDTATTNTGSAATGSARIVVDLDAQSVDLKLTVSGLTIDGLWDPLVASGMGPIHLHLYAMSDHDHGGDASLVLPLPFGPTYAATADGFVVTTDNYSYAEGAHVLGSATSFDAFVRSLENGAVVLNIHTDAFHEGEISGAVARAPG